MAATPTDAPRSTRYPPKRYLAAGIGILADLRRWYRGQPTTSPTYRAARIAHRTTAGYSSRVLLSALREIPGSPDRLGPPRARLDGRWASAAGVLRRDGVTYLPNVLTDDAATRLREFARDAPAYVRAADGSTRPGTYATRTGSDATVSIVEEFVLAHPDVQALLADPRIHEFARRHFGVGVVVHPPLLYWSCAGATPRPDVRMALARAFHWDYDGLRGLRLHLYLSDVDDGAAPMQYVVGSQRPGAYRTRALRHGDLGVEAAQVDAAFGADRVRTMAGPAGTTFISESSGLHRGTDPVTADRLFLVLPIQATGFAGFNLKARTVAPRDPAFAAALAQHRPELRLLRPADAG